MGLPLASKRAYIAPDCSSEDANTTQFHGLKPLMGQDFQWGFSCSGGGAQPVILTPGGDGNNSVHMTPLLAGLLTAPTSPTRVL